MRPPQRQREIDALIKSFEEVIDRVDPCTVDEARQMIEKATADKYDPRELEAILPKDVWETVRAYLSEGGDAAMETVPDDLKEFAEKVAEKSTKPRREVAKITSDNAESLRALKRQATLKHMSPTSSAVLSTIYDNPRVPGASMPNKEPPKPAHVSTIGKEATISDLTLSRFYDTEPVTKSKTPPKSPALRGLYSALEEQ